MADLYVQPMYAPLLSTVMCRTNVFLYVDTSHDEEHLNIDICRCCLFSDEGRRRWLKRLVLSVGLASVIF